MTLILALGNPTTRRGGIPFRLSHLNKPISDQDALRLAL